MILPSTLRKCAERGEKVYMVKMPSWTMKRAAFGGDDIDCPNPPEDRFITESTEFFVSQSRALFKAAECTGMTDFAGGPIAEVYTVPAADIDPWTMKLTSEGRVFRIN